MRVGQEGMSRNLRKRTFDLENTLHRPINCEECEGLMIFKGVGEYECEKCGFIAYDDYGKTRLFLEKNPGANAGEVELRTGVSQKSIRQMLKEKRFEISADSAVFMTCEICGAQIRSGSMCAKCEKEYHQRVEDEARKNRAHAGSGFGMQKLADPGAKRFDR